MSKMSRKQLNELYCEFYLLNNKELQLTRKQFNVSCKKSKSTLLFCDELNRATLETRQVALQLVLEKELHSHKLPYVDGKRTFIVSAINPADKYQVFELDTALLDRFTTIEMVVDVESFLDYSKENGLEQVIIDFISEFPDRLHMMFEDDSKGPTPRSWEVVSNYIKNNTDKGRLYNALEGRLGSTVALQFFEYYNNYGKNITLDTLEALISKNIKLELKDVISIVKEKTENLEVIRKKEIFKQSVFKYKDELERKDFVLGISPLIFLYAFDVEMIYAALKEIKNTPETEKLYYWLVDLDVKLNKKEFFLNLAKVHLGK